MRSDLKITYQNGILRDPYVISLEIANVGRSYIGNEAFDNKDSLVFGMNTPVVKVLSVVHEPKSSPYPNITATGKDVSLAPGLISKGELIRMALLTEGCPNGIDVIYKPFGDVEIDIKDREASSVRITNYRRALRVVVPATILSAVLLTVSLIMAIHADQRLAKTKRTATQITVEASCNALIQDLQSVALGITLARTDITISKDRAGAIRKISFGSSYHTIINRTATAGDAAAGAYNLMDQAGIRLGRSAFTLDQVARAITILISLPKKGVNAALPSDLAFIEKVARNESIKNSPALPPACY